MKKKRTSLLVLSIIGVVLFLLGVAGYIYSLCCSNKESIGVPFTDMNKGIMDSFSNFSGSPLQATLTIILTAVALILFVVWIIVGVKRNNKVWIWFAIFLAIVTYANLCYDALYVLVIKGIIELFKQGAVQMSFDLLVLPIGAICTVLSALFVIICFIIDMATGRQTLAYEYVEPKVEPAPVVSNEPATTVEEVKEETKEEVKEDTVTPTEEVVITTEATKKVSKNKKNTKKTEKKTETKKGDANMKKAKKEPAKKAPAKKAALKKAAAKKPAPKKAPAKKPEPKVEKVYHVSKRASDGLWTIKFAGGEKVIKTFKTKAEAIEYADTLKENQNGIVLTHASKGAKQGKINAKR